MSGKTLFMREEVRKRYGVEKACTCEGASASGPRPVVTGSFWREGKLVTQIRHVALACDRCNTPWRKVEP